MLLTSIICVIIQQEDVKSNTTLYLTSLICDIILNIGIFIFGLIICFSDKYKIMKRFGIVYLLTTSQIIFSYSQIGYMIPKLTIFKNKYNSKYEYIFENILVSLFVTMSTFMANIGWKYNRNLTTVSYIILYIIIFLLTIISSNIDYKQILY